ncbi:hypothetical protein SEVIR_5G240251v4 [Setaria viridis]
MAGSASSALGAFARRLAKSDRLDRTGPRAPPPGLLLLSSRRRRHQLVLVVRVRTVRRWDGVELSLSRGEGLPPEGCRRAQGGDGERLPPRRVTQQGRRIARLEKAWEEEMASRQKKCEQ